MSVMSEIISKTLTNNIKIYGVERISTVQGQLYDLLILEPQSDGYQTAAVSLAEAMTETGTLVIATGEGDKRHNVDRVRKETLSLRQHESRSLQHYLSRPICIYTRLVTGGFSDTREPLFDYLNSSFIRDKVRGYAYLNAKLHIKVTVTSPPQVSGAVHVALHPWWVRDTGLGAMSNNADYRGITHVQMTQLPHVLVDFGSETGGEISMPIICPSNGLNISDTENIKGAFLLHLRTLINVEKPPSVTASPSFQVYAWLTEVDLVGTTLKSELVPQSDEYHKQPADVVHSLDVSIKDTAKLAARNIAGKATDIGVDALFSVVGLNSPNDPKGSWPVSLRACGNMATTNMAVNIENLASDCKNEVTTSLDVLGYDEEDPMALDNILTRWGLITSHPFPVGSTTVGTPTLLLPVSPTAVSSFKLQTQTCYSPTPLAVTALGFSKWRGTVRYKFKAIGSAFMKGKMRISHDVNNINMAGLGPIDISRLNTIVWDLGVSREIIVDVPWTSNYPFKTVSLLSDAASFSLGDTASTLNFTGTNGTLLVTPFTTISDGINPNIHVLVYHCGKAGMAFGDVRPVLTNYTFSGINNGSSGIPEPQSDSEYRIPDGIMFDEAGNLSILEYSSENILFRRNYYIAARQVYDTNPYYVYTDVLEYMFPKNKIEPQSFILTKELDNSLLTGENKNSTLCINIAGLEDNPQDTDDMLSACMGEKFFNLRQIIKRYTMNFTRNISFLATGEGYFINMPDRPIMKGWQGIDSLNIDPNGKRCTYARDSFLSFYSVCFLGMRGSLRHKVEVSAPNGTTDTPIYITRSRAFWEERKFPAQTAANNANASHILNSPDFRAGGAIQNKNISNVIEYSTPFQCRSKFVWAQDRTPQYPRSSDDGGFDYSGHAVTIYTSGSTNRHYRINKYVAAGDDFTLLHFMYAPTMVAMGPGLYPQN